MEYESSSYLKPSQNHLFSEEENGLDFYCFFGPFPSESSILVGLETCFTNQRQLHQHAELGQDALGTR